MISYLDNLVLNLAFLVASLFLHQQFYARFDVGPASSVRIKILYGFTLGLIGILLMHYTIRTPQSIIDLRQLTMIVAAIYSGPLASIVSAVVVAIGRYFLFEANTNTWIGIANALAIGIGCALLVRPVMREWMKWIVLPVFSTTTVFVALALQVKDRALLFQLYQDYLIIMFVGVLVTRSLCTYLTRSQELFKRYRDDATRDSLTGLNNVRKFDELLRRSVAVAEGKREDLALMFIDIDHFKNVNDTYGHPAGDEVLRQLGRILESSSRMIDVPSRNGGEEFSILLPVCPPDLAGRIAENVRRAVEAHPFALPDGTVIHLTVSIGLAGYHARVPSADALVKQADEALYDAKRSGRNRVCTS